MKFCTCHDSSAVMACAKFHCDYIFFQNFKKGKISWGEIWSEELVAWSDTVPSMLPALVATNDSAIMAVIGLVSSVPWESGEMHGLYSVSPGSWYIYRYHILIWENFVCKIKIGSMWMKFVCRDFFSSSPFKYMGQVTEVRLSCYLVLLSNNSKTR